MNWVTVEAAARRSQVRERTPARVTSQISGELLYIDVTGPYGVCHMRIMRMIFISIKESE